MRRPCFAEEDFGLACLAAGTEVGSSSAHNSVTSPKPNPFISRSMRSSSYRSLSSFSSVGSSSPRPLTRLYDVRFEEPHFLEACFLCKKHLGDNQDIFMYRGDTPFCSEECRQEQIEIDEAKEKRRSLSSSMKAVRKDQQTKSTPDKSQNYYARTSPVVAS